MRHRRCLEGVRCIEKHFVLFDSSLSHNNFNAGDNEFVDNGFVTDNEFVDNGFATAFGAVHSLTRSSPIFTFKENVRL